MIETVQAVNNLEEIAKAPGIDGFYIGPSDLAVSLGIPTGPSTFSDPQHAAACQRVVDVARARRALFRATTAAGPEEAVRRMEQGFMMCQLGSDVGMVRASAAAALKTVADGLAPS